MNEPKPASEVPIQPELNTSLLSIAAQIQQLSEQYKLPPKVLYEQLQTISAKPVTLEIPPVVTQELSIQPETAETIRAGIVFADFDAFQGSGLTYPIDHKDHIMDLSRGERGGKYPDMVPIRQVFNETFENLEKKT